ncbi:MAG: ABC-three component system middle component 6 [Brumimicrobium sp.]
MIISRDINPERDFYYLGARTIEILSSTEDEKVDFFYVFDTLKSSEDISLNLFTLTLDWLFIIGAIHETQKGYIKKCF